MSRVVDGDTIELGNGETVRVVGIDTPERGERGYGEATVNMERVVLGKRVGLGQSDEDRDHYGRLLRYVNVGQVDAGLRQIKAGLAIARYDSRDGYGYGYHPREDRYITADNNSPHHLPPASAGARPDAEVRRRLLRIDLLRELHRRTRRLCWPRPQGRPRLRQPARSRR